MDTALSPQPIDLAQLARQTGGDERLARDVLRLFLDGSVADLARLEAASGVARREAAHLLVGSARAIGAEDVALAAAAIEAGGEAVVGLEAALADARRFIAAYLAR